MKLKARASELLDAVREVAALAGAVALRHFQTRLTVETKNDGSPVTIADREAERAARDWITARFPGDGILGEEFGEVASSAQRRWLIDPIDGTKTFVRGVPLWGSLVAVVDKSGVLAGAAAFPALDEMLVAARGEGCWWNDVRCSVSSVSSLAGATVLTTDERFLPNESQRKRWRTLADAAAVARSWGDCYGYLLVATGRAEVMVDGTLSDWDAACLQPIIEEAGGVFTDWTGARTPFGKSAIATNAALDVAVRDILVGARAGQQPRG